MRNKSKHSLSIESDVNKDLSGEPGILSQLVSELLQEFIDIWWSCDRSIPRFEHHFSSEKQVVNEKRLKKMVDGLVHEIKHFPQTLEEQKSSQSRLREGFYPFANDALHLNKDHLNFIETSGILESLREFAQQARNFDPNLTAADIYQAGRNVMTANFIQLLLGLEVETTLSIFAYSMLYPYTDNYLDEPNIPMSTKQSFNQRFQRRLMGEKIQLENDYEKNIDRLVELIEEQWEREKYPRVYESLLAIHSAQVKSLKLILPGAVPYELDVLGISFEKGGASVLADGYLVAGELKREQARYLFGYGTFTQMMDDMEDIEQDKEAGYMSIFSQTAIDWPLDKLANRVIHFGRVVLGDLNVFHSHASSILNDLITISIDPILIDIIGRNKYYFSRNYLHQLEKHSSFRFNTIEKQRKKLMRKKIDAERVLDVFITE